MAFSKTAISVAEVETTKITVPAVDPKVRGQVAMHAIVAGYHAASRLVLTLAPKPTDAEELLHTLAAAIAAKIEAYSFHE